MHLLLRTSVCLLKATSITKEWTVVQFAFVKHFHKSCQALSNEKKPMTDVLRFPFHAMETKKKETFLDVIHLYIKENQLRTGHVEFIRQALKYMDEFGVNKELEVYKALLDVFPKGKFIPENIFQIMCYHYPKQQDTALEILTKMEQNQVLPDYEMQEMLLNIFGERGYPLKKLWRMIYWMPKFSKLNPWPCSDSISKDVKKLAQYSLKKMSGMDVQNKITEYKTKDVPDAIDDTWIMSSMSKSQSELLALQPTDKSLSIEGPFMIWMGKQCMDYFVLRGDPIKREIIYETFDGKILCYVRLCFIMFHCFYF